MGMAPLALRTSCEQSIVGQGGGLDQLGSAKCTCKSTCSEG